MKRAPFWVFIDQGAGRFVRLAASIVLARILIPEDFGIYAFSLSILELARMLGNIGIGSSLIQTQQDPREFAQSAFWLNLTASLFMFLLGWIGGKIGAQYYGEPILRYTVPVLGITFISGGLIHINHSLLIRDLEFKKLAKMSFTKLFVESLVAIILAVSGFGVWAFILGYVCGDVAFSFFIWVWTDWRPSIKPQFSYPIQYWKFGGHIFLLGLANYMLENIPIITVGKITTTAVVGYFSFALRQSRWVGDLPKLIGRNFLFPAFSRLQNSGGEFQSLYTQWIRFMMIWVSPVFILQCVLAPIYIPLIFGEKWMPAVSALQVLTIFIFLDAAFYVVHSEALTSMMRAGYNTLWRIIESMVLGFGLFYAARMNLFAISLTILVIRVIVLPVFFLTTSGHLHIQLKSLLRETLPAALTATVGWVGFALLYHYEKNIIWLAALTFLGMILWCLVGIKMVPEILSFLKDGIAKARQLFPAFREKASLQS